MSQYKMIIENIFLGFSLESLKNNKYFWFALGLLIVSILYYYYGFMLSFIPYSTAWDANHLYMYVPKVWAENAGALGYGNPGGAGNYIWLSYIAMFFSLIEPIKSRFWLSPDNIAVSMNYLSAIFVLFFGLGLFKEFVGYIASVMSDKYREIIENTGFYVGWLMLLLWLTSGMGAFLVFVDNKSDMGVLSMTLLAILSGLVFVRYVHEHHSKKDQSIISKYVMISGLFFSLAVAAKPTAFIDVVVFVIFLLALWLNNWISLGVGVLVIAIIARMQILFTAEFLSASSFWPLLVLAVVLILIGIFMGYRKDEKFKESIVHTFKTFSLWGFVFVATLLIVKGPYLIIGGIQSGEFSISSFAKGLIMGYGQKQEDEKLVLLANLDEDLDKQNIIDSSLQISPEMCDLGTLGISEEDLYKNVRDFEGGGGLNEDFGRYVGFGRKEFNRGIFYNVVRPFLGETGNCIGFDKNAVAFCENEEAINNFDLSVMQSLYESVNKDSRAYELLDNAFNDPKFKSMMENDNFNPLEMRQNIVDMRLWYQGRSIKVRENSIMVPYRYVVPWNATFNRSLQNLSSYYTDIGFIRGILIFVLVIAWFYAIFRGNKKIIAILNVSFVGWIIWWIIAAGIVRYGIGLIIWSSLALVGFLMLLINDLKSDKDSYFGFNVFIIILLFFACIQVIMNFVRISSQGGGGPFVWYKTSVGTVNYIEDNLAQIQKQEVPYLWKDVFDLQFGHYNRFIEYAKDRKDEDGVSIAGTYIQYFLHNQNNLGRANIYRLTSDGNTCKSYLRFRNDNWRYIIIDPNILSVVMGEGNESLMHRFFARRNPVNGGIQEDGEMTMIVKMWYDGYLSLFHSNNLGAKYAFELDDQILKDAFDLQTYDELVYMRAKMSVARFFPDANEIINFVANVFIQRIANGLAISDIADIFGKTINEIKVFDVAQRLVAGENPNNIRDLISQLDQDERFVILQYISLYNLMRQNNQEFQSVIQNIMMQSLAGGSQLMIFELKE